MMQFTRSIGLLAFFVLFSTLLQARYKYTLTWENPNTHTYIVSLETAPRTGGYTDFSVAAWRPGRYILQDYAAAISQFSATDGQKNSLKWMKIRKDTWRVFHESPEKIRVQYHYYAENPDAGSSYLGVGEAYFNPVNFFMYVPGKLDEPVSLQVPDLPDSWGIATALQKGPDGKSFSAGSWHEFADSPTVFSDRMKQFHFVIDSVDFYLHFSGNYQGGELIDKMIVRDVELICREQAAVFGDFPFREYHFIYRLMDYYLRHAVEHANSSSFVIPATVTGSQRALPGGLYGITSHEFWHAWNVKRIRPAALWPYDYSKEAYTGLHWFTEGVTDYYSDIALLRAGLVPEEKFLQEMSNTITRLERNYACREVSPQMASFDSWLATSPYRHPHLGVSYYPLGQRLGFLMDLALRDLTANAVSLDDVFRSLYQEYYLMGKGVPEDGVQRTCEELTQSSWQEFFDAYVYGTENIPYETFLAPFGLQLEVKTQSNAGLERLGITDVGWLDEGLLVEELHPGGDAFRDGLAEKDIILEVDGKPVSEGELGDYLGQLKLGAKVRLKVFSEFRFKELTIYCKEAYVPKTFTIRKMDNPNTGQKQNWAELIRSLQK